jgi:methionyl-tRNA synthetase
MIEKNKKFYITTTLPYVNAKPHIGFALEIIQADVVARNKRKQGFDVFFNTGTDEHGLKIFQKALEENKGTQEYCDEYAAKFDLLKNALDLSYDNFIRTTDEQHKKAAQEMWNRCLANDDIYKKNYKVKYCVGCEMGKTESELVDGRCPDHPNKDLEEIEEENYFFRYSKYEEKLLRFYEDNPDFVIPNFRQKEIKNFTENGLQDFSISRLKEKMPWGVSVPDDDNHVMYVWFDALVNYISCLGWPENQEKFDSFWPGIQVAGKDNLRQQTSMWQAMLMSAGLPNSKQVLIHGFIISGGQKMAKSLGNVIDPIEMVEKYGTEAVRFYLLSEIDPFDDSDLTMSKFEEIYNSKLANGIGNLVARVSNLLEKNEIQTSLKKGTDEELAKQVDEQIEKYKFNDALKLIWSKIKESDEYLSEHKPWKMEDAAEIEKVLVKVAQDILNIAVCLEPFLPEVSSKITEQFSSEQIKKGESLFPRIS